MLCTNCGHHHIEGASFCAECGTPINPSGWSPLSPSARRAGGPVAVPWSSRHVVLAIVLVAVSALIVTQAIVLVVGTDNPALVAWLTSISLGLVIFAIVWFLGLRPYKAPIAMLGLTPPGMPSPKTVGMTIGTLLLSLGATAAYAVTVRLIGPEILVPPDIPRGIVFPGTGVVLTFLALALWTPLSEEVFFRGFVFAGLSSRWRVTGAMFISAAIFSIFHISLGVLIPIFITGFLLAWLYRKTGSIWASIAAHAGQNAAALVATLYGV